MTLATTIRIEQPTDPRALLNFLTELVGGDPETALRYDMPGKIGNRVGQGFSAIVEVSYGLDGPLDLEYLDHESDFDIEWKTQHPDDLDNQPFVPAPTAAVQVDLDTTYGYRDDLGRGCVELHRDLAVAVAEYVGAPVWFNLDINGEWEKTS